MPMVSIIVPAFNEQKSIDSVLADIHKVVQSYPFSSEVIVVDDGSADNTQELARRSNAIVLSNKKNRGKAFALQQGFRHARGDIIVTIDADGSHDPRDIGRLILPILNGADVVLGSRFATGQGRSTTSKLHILGNILINFLILFVTGKYVTDSQTGFRSFRSKVVHEIDIVSKGYQVETELTVKCLRNGSIVREIPVIARKRISGQTGLNPMKDGLGILKVILLSSLRFDEDRSIDRHGDE